MSEETHRFRHRIYAAAGAIVSVAILCVALWFLHRELSGLSRQAIVDHAQSIPLMALLISALFAIGSYTVLTGYDALALRYINCKVPYRRSAITSFMAFAVGHNVGLVALSGGSIRYRMYSLQGLSVTEIATIIAFVSITFFIGASALLGVALLLMPDSQLAVLKLPRGLVQAAAIAMLLIAPLYLAFAFLRRQPLMLRSWQVQMPGPLIAIGQVVASIAELIFTAAVLYVLLAPTIHIGFVPFMGIFLLALAAGLISNVPGGIGVFEAVLVAALPQADASAVLGTVIIYRLIYYIAPLITALTMLGVHEISHHREVLSGPVKMAGRWVTAITPQVIGVMVFLAGCVLLVSGASPAVEARLSLIAKGIPLPILELSHLIGSVLGVGLLVVARGLFRRLSTAYWVAKGVLVVGIVVSLLKGLDYEEALFLGLILLSLLFSKKEFYRKGSVAAQRYSFQWILAITLAMCFALWVGLVSYRHIEYSDQLWWKFAFQADAPRMLRASVVSAVTILAFVFWKVLRGGATVAEYSHADEVTLNVRKVLESSVSSSSNLALLGDKRFLWSKDESAFIMYQVSGDSWIAMGDPVGPTEAHEELVWAFRELADRRSGQAVFYQVSQESLSVYVDNGLALAKLGEDARVPLEGFSLQGSHRSDLRQAVNRAKKNGAVFEVLPRDQIPSVVAELRRVSDSWLADKGTAEKGFSLGAFSESYIVQFDCAVVRVEGTIVAFANLWPARAGSELSIDLMRYTQNAPKSVMDYLFAELILWGSANGYQWFSLGMAPLSGLEQRKLAPLWHKLGHLVYTHGESFYNFEGLRSYKEKFQPVWQPRYLACKGGWLTLPRALVDASRLISGGITRTLKK